MYRRGVDPPPDPPETHSAPRNIYERIVRDVREHGALPPNLHGLPRTRANIDAVLSRLSLQDLHTLRMQSDRNAALERELRGVRGGPWGNPALAMAGGWQRQGHGPEHNEELEERWRAQQVASLPPIGPAAAATAAGGVRHPYGLPGSPQIHGMEGRNAWDNAPAGYQDEIGRSNAERAPVARPDERAAPVAAAPRSSGGDGSLFDILATAAEGQLRKENQEAGKPKAKRGRKPKSQEAAAARGDSTAILQAMNKPAAAASTGNRNKKKRKAANEPKNPLGAFVFYQRKMMSDVFEDNPCITFGEAAAECGRRWKALDESEKKQYKDMAAADKER